MKDGLTQERLKELLDYEPETGLFRWKISISRRAIVGEIAGSDHGNGYIEIGILGKKYYCHRIAWLYMTGEWPASQIDHINRVRRDNRWGNLREATQSENMLNNAACGFYWSKSRNKFIAEITINKKSIHAGQYSCMLDARAAYLRTRKQYLGELR